MVDSSSRRASVPIDPLENNNMNTQSDETTRSREASSPPEPFPTITPPGSPSTRPRGESSTSTLRGRLRTASKRFEESNPPLGFMDATGTIASSIPSLADIRRGSFGSDGWSGEGQLKERQRRASLGRRSSSHSMDSTSRSHRGTNTSSGPDGKKQGLPGTIEERPSAEHPHKKLSAEVPRPFSDDIEKVPIETDGAGERDPSTGSNGVSRSAAATAGQKPVYDANAYRTEPFDNGYEFPPKHTWTESTMIFLRAFWKFFCTPLGFLVTIYGLNVVAWGGMIFLLLCNAAPAMCHPSCNDINSPRRIWIEIDSQVLTGLFCVTGFGLIPWRFRDLYYLLRYRIKGEEIALRRLAGIHRGWFRLKGSESLPLLFGPDQAKSEANTITQTAIAYPPESTPNAPLTGIRAPATPVWKLDYVIWMYVWNTFLQAVLSGVMWGLNRYDRPSWTTGLFVALACIVAALGGLMVFMEGRKVNKVEGVPVSERDLEKLRLDREAGIVHWNNISAKPPKEVKEKEKQEKKDSGSSKHLFGKHNKEVSPTGATAAQADGVVG